LLLELGDALALTQVALGSNIPGLARHGVKTVDEQLHDKDNQQRRSTPRSLSWTHKNSLADALFFTLFLVKMNEIPSFLFFLNTKKIELNLKLKGKRKE